MKQTPIEDLNHVQGAYEPQEAGLTPMLVIVCIVIASLLITAAYIGMGKA